MLTKLDCYKRGLQPYWYIELNGKTYIYNSTRDEAEEFACMQYCIENGVKLEWFDGRTISYYNSSLHWHKEDDDLQWFAELALDQLHEEKLIAAIYAHDIKIIAT
jgi:hypothetical protein